MSEILCYDKSCDRYFKTDPVKLYYAQKELNKMIKAKEHLSYYDVIDILNSQLPPEHQIGHSGPWGHSYEIGDILEFTDRNKTLADGSITIEFNFEQKCGPA